MTSGHHGNHNAVKWAPEHDDALRRLHAAGLSGAQVGVAINREFRTGYSRNAVIGRKLRLGLTTPNVAGRNRSAVAAPKKPNTSDTRPRAKWSEPKLEPEQIQLRAADVVPRNLPLLELGPNDCRYPYGNGPFSFCGHRKTPGSSYCFEHDCLTRRA